jgi:hypothetical protein
MVETLEIRLGKAFHAVMEHVDKPLVVGQPQALTQGCAWLDRLLATLALTTSEQALVGQAVAAVLSNPVARDVLFPKEQGAQVLIEADCLSVDGQWLRPDRVVIHPKDPSIRLIDFKWRVLPSEHRDYLQQLARYSDVLALAYPNHDLQAYLIDALGGIWHCRDGELVHC